ncbi:hypothetical protein O3M35_000317 [Rhynocoris fuscipes]|uniref:Uncharacterized protein n=1 Tax=Rhynocoris fuscipes TaxID=488301 RepID=A0AAW1DN06_9HEMI
MSVEDKSELLHTQLLASCNIIPGINIVNCSLKELPLHCPTCASDTTAQKGLLSSSQRRKLSKAPGLPPADIFAQLTVEQIVMSRKPTLIDRLISKNKTALIMESRARKRGGKPIKEDISMNGKRKANSAEDHLEKKRLRSSKADIKKDVQKTVLPAAGRKRKSEADPPPGTNRYATRISMNKVRIPFSLRSGRKMADILKSKRKRGRKQHLQQNITEKKINQVDTDQHGNKIKSEEIKPKKKRRKRCSMWVRKNKRPSKKVEDLPVLNKVESEEDDKTEVEEEVEPLMPTLEKQIDHKDVILKDEEIKHESLDISSQSKNLVVNEIVETKSSAFAAKVPTVDNYEVLAESNLEIKNEENNCSIQQSKCDDNEEIQMCETITDIPPNEQNIATQEIIGTKPQSPINSGIELDRPENSNSDLGQPLKISSSTSEKIGNNIRNLQTNGTLEAENENIKTEYQTSFDIDIQENDRKLNSMDDNGSLITEEQMILHKGLKKCVDPVNETELNVTDIQKSCNLNCDITSNPDVKKDKEENYQIHLNGNVEPQESFRQKLNEPDTLIQIKEGNNAVVLNNPPNEEEMKIRCTEDEEIHPREADSTSDVPLTTVGSSASEQFSKIYNVELTKSPVEVPVLPDSTKEVKSSSPEIKLEKEQTNDGDILNLEKSSQNKDLPIKNNTESKSNKVNVKDISEKRSSVNEEGYISVERKQMKESVLQALGLKSLSAATDHKLQNDEDKQKNNNQQQQRNNSGYTGTLKAVIKLNRSGDKKRSMVYKRSEDALSTSDKLEYRICSDFPSTESVPITHLADMGYNKKGFHHKNSDSVTNSVYVNTNVGNSNNEETDVNGEDSKGSKESSLIIPEKSSSFSIHPGRLCSDVCSYCFGKFGSLDTPCHVAQIKGEERQKKILQNEPHLTPESCLCDACYRYVDRKVNYHPKTGNQQQGTNNTNNNNSSSNTAPKSHHQPQPQASCCVVGCLQQATHTIKRKGILKLKKNLTNKLDIDMDKHTGLYFPFCSQHHYWVEYLTVCGICRKRLNRNSLFSLGSEADKLNLMLAEDGIPARLSDNLFLCKLCRYYSNLRLKYSDASAIPSQNKSFYKSYRRKILMSLDIAVSNSEDECDNSEDSSTPEKKHIASTSSSNRKVIHSATNGGTGGNIVADNPAAGSSSNNESTSEETVSLSDLATLLGDQPEPQQTRIQVKFGNVNIGTLSNLNIGQQGAGSASSPATTDRESSEGSLLFDFKGPSPDGNLERCVTTIQFDKKAKQLWTELQKPHGSQSLFLRHLIMMEKIWRAGHLVLSANADEKAIKYVLNAKNKIRACENSTVNAAGSNISPTNAVRPSKPKETCQPAVHPVRLQQQLQQPPLKVQPKPPQLQPQLLQSSHAKPQVPKQLVQQQITTPTQERFPLLPNNGEIEVTPVRTTAQTQVVTVVPSPVITVTSSLQQQQYMRPTNLQNLRPNVPQTNSNNQTTNVLQQQLMSKKLTPLDRAKSLVRMAIPQHRPPPPRYYIPPQNLPAGHQHYYVGGGNSNRAPPPPLMKLQSYYQHQQQLNQQSAIQQQPPSYQQHSYIQQQLQQPPQPRTILPKLPKSLTVVSRMNNKPTAITLRNSGITIEKQSSVPSMRSSHPLPVEKPIISVFREPATSPQQH